MQPRSLSSLRAFVCKSSTEVSDNVGILDVISWLTLVGPVLYVPSEVLEYVPDPREFVLRVLLVDFRFDSCQRSSDRLDISQLFVRAGSCRVTDSPSLLGQSRANIGPLLLSPRVRSRNVAAHVLGEPRNLFSPGI